jgi:hypothetical protein
MSVTYGPKLGKMINALAGDTFAIDFRAMLRAFDQLVQANVKSMAIATPPTSPANGDAYIVPASPTGTWVGETNKLTVWTTDNPAAPAGEWEYYPPNAGFLIYNVATAGLFAWTGSAWVAAGGGGASAFTGLSDVPAAYTGAGGYGVQVNAGATALVFVAKPFDVSTFAAGLGTASQILLRVNLARAVTFPASATLSQASASANATGSTTFTLKKNGTSFATVNFAAAAAVGTWTQASGSVFAAGDLLEIDGPATADATLANVGITLAGVRA